MRGFRALFSVAILGAAGCTATATVDPDVRVVRHEACERLRVDRSSASTLYATALEVREECARLGLEVDLERMTIPGVLLRACSAHLCASSRLRAARAHGAATVVACHEREAAETATQLAAAYDASERFGSAYDRRDPRAMVRAGDETEAGAAAAEAAAREKRCGDAFFFDELFLTRSSAPITSTPSKTKR